MHLKPCLTFAKHTGVDKSWRISQRKEKQNPKPLRYYNSFFFFLTENEYVRQEGSRMYQLYSFWSKSNIWRALTMLRHQWAPEMKGPREGRPPCSQDVHQASRCSESSLHTATFTFPGISTVHEYVHGIIFIRCLLLYSIHQAFNPFFFLLRM